MFNRTDHHVISHCFSTSGASVSSINYQQISCFSSYHTSVGSESTFCFTFSFNRSCYAEKNSFSNIIIASNSTETAVAKSAPASICRFSRSYNSNIYTIFFIYSSGNSCCNNQLKNNTTLSVNVCKNCVDFK